jgi:uncharacterized protein (TIGR03067 family)
MRKLWAMCVCTLAVTLCATGLTTGQGDKDKPSIEGTWKMTKLMYDGKDFSELIKDKIVVMTFGKENKWTSKENDKVDEGKYKVDVSKKPMHIDMTKGGGNKEEVPGIFTVEGDMLSIAVPSPAKKDMPAKRPASFEDKEIVVLTLKKQQ